jgi:antitoxin MazE
VSVDIEAVVEGGLRLTPLKHSPSIDELVAEITDENRQEEADWGRPAGNEAW